ncbi:MAG: hypothetical protein U0168_14820 [Nannocystaceae bacterium]
MSKQAPVSRLQALSGHCSWNEQPTQLLVPSSQTGELPSHALLR